MPFEHGNQYAAKKGETNTARVQLRMKPSQLKKWEARATRDGYESMSEWVRDVCDEAAKQRRRRTPRL